MLASSSKRSQMLLPVLHIGFFLIGIVNTLLGPLLPLLSMRWQLDDTQAGALFFVQSTAAIVGSALTGQIIRRFGYQITLISGFILMSVSTSGLGFTSWLYGMICVAGMGLSLGLTIPTINVLISEINPTRRAAALNILNLAWGVGAVVGPLVIPLVSRRTDLFVVLMFVGIPIAMIGLLVRTDSRAVTKEDDSSRKSSHAWFTPYFLLTAAFVFINVGTETALGGWIASYVQRLNQSSELAWATATSVFWGGILLGRAFAPLILMRMRDLTLVLFGVFVAVVGLSIVLLSSRPMTVLLGVGLAGLGLAPVFPTTLAIFTARFRDLASRLAGTLFIFAGLGSAVFPWLVGIVSNLYQDLQMGLIVPFVGAVLMLTVHVAIMLSLSQRGFPKVTSET